LFKLRVPYSVRQTGYRVQILGKPAAVLSVYASENVGNHRINYQTNSPTD